MKKTLATILALVLALSLCSIAWATETQQENVAKVGDTEYATLQEAVNQTTAGTITLLKNVDEDRIE